MRYYPFAMNFCLEQARSGSAVSSVRYVNPAGVKSGHISPRPCLGSQHGERGWGLLVRSRSAAVTAMILHLPATSQRKEFRQCTGALVGPRKGHRCPRSPIPHRAGAARARSACIASGGPLSSQRCHRGDDGLNKLKLDCPHRNDPDSEPTIAPCSFAADCSSLSTG